MEYQDESMPLNPSMNVILTQNRLQVRGNMRQTLDRTLQTSYFLVTFKLTLTISKVIPTQMLASAFIVTFHETKVDQPLLLWVLLSFVMVHCFLELVLVTNCSKRAIVCTTMRWRSTNVSTTVAR